MSTRKPLEPPTTRRLTIVLAVWLSAGAAFAEEHEAHLPLHELSFFAGLGVESKEGHHDEEGFAVGAGYELQFHEKWGIGVGIEGLGLDTIRNFVLVFPVSFHPAEGWKILAGPGLESTPQKDKLAFRLGAGYEIELNDRWSFGPEFYVDLIESGENTWVIGLVLGFEL